MQLEVCIESLQEAELANRNKCHRIEVCSALDLGGLTPSHGLIQACSKLHNIESHILIRPRPGNFVYSTKEIILMKEDIRMAAEAGAKGVVFGCLNSDNNINLSSCELLIRHAKAYQLETTFHRAIDFTIDFSLAFQAIIYLGFDRILTSGQKPKAIDGIENIKLLQKLNYGQIEIMAGSGIFDENVLAFQEIGIDAIHFSIRKKKEGSYHLGMGYQYLSDEDKLKNIINKLRGSN